MKLLLSYDYELNPNVCTRLGLTEKVNSFQNNLIIKRRRLKVEEPERLLDYFIAIFQFHKTTETRLYSKLLRPVIGRNYKEIMDALIKGGLISKSKNFISGIMSNSYKLNVIPDRQSISYRNIYLERLLDPSKIYSEDSINQAKNVLIAKYKEWIKDTKLELNKSEYNALSSDQKRYIDNINNNNFWIKTDKFNARIFTPVSCLKKELRKKIKIDNEETCEVDIMGSFCQMIYKMQYAFNADKNFRKCVEKGDVYSYLAKKLHITREQAKNYFNASLNAKIDGWQHPYIVKLFPNLFEKVNSLRHSYGHGIISMILQRKEAISVFKIATELMELGIKHFTVHDYLKTIKIFIHVPKIILLLSQ
ncbi:MAG: hypothetical protein ACYDCN_07345 [Bacteroidia bacterium]